MRINNRFAKSQFHIQNSFEVGIVLTGAEVKSLRLGRGDLGHSFAKIQNGEVFLKNFYIPPLQGQEKDVDYRSDRKLLLKRDQITELQNKLQKPGMTLIPLAVYFTRNLAKVELSLARSKSKVDKRRTVKDRDNQRSIERDLKSVS